MEDEGREVDSQCPRYTVGLKSASLKTVLAPSSSQQVSKLFASAILGSSAHRSPGCLLNLSFKTAESGPKLSEGGEEDRAECVCLGGRRERGHSCHQRSSEPRTGQALLEECEVVVRRFLLSLPSP